MAIITLMIATIAVEPGWGIGAVALSDPFIDRDILLDAAGNPWVPGSALAGSLRAHLAAVRPDDVQQLMGSHPPSSQAEAEDSIVSPLWIVGCVFRPGDAGPGEEPALLETVGQTAIDRERGAAAAGSLRFSRLAACGGTLKVYLRHDAPDDKVLTTEDLDLIVGWRPAIGRDRTKGAGRATLTELRHGTVNPTTSAGAEVWLSNSGPGLFEAVATNVITCGSRSQPWLTARFRIEDGLLAGDSLPGPVAQSLRRNGRPLVPGSAWKGIIRSRTEFIIRSRYGETAACQQQPGCGTCVICAVFGHQGQRGLLAFRDSYIEDPDTPPERTHVGIDRVAGGSREALLFQTQPVTSGHLQLQIDELGQVQPWVRNVIRHVLRDIDDGLIGVGSRTTRGLGTLRLIEPLGDLDPVIVPTLDAIPNRNQRYDRLT